MNAETILQDTVIDVIEDEGPVSSERIQQVTGWTRKRVENALFRAKRRGDIRVSSFERLPGKGGQATALYALALKADQAFSPASLINSVWQLGSRA